jgi:hypothetical protein
VLELCYRNRSSDIAFSPTDPFFDRRWKDAGDGSKPYTFLEIGDRRFYGGPIPWTQASAGARDEIEGQVYRVLDPGEELTTIACSDPADPIAELLKEYQGPIVWRLQLRRGLTSVGGKTISATAVIGVKFDASEVERLQS